MARVIDPELSIKQQIKAHTRWSRTPDRTAATAEARRQADARFERQVDPEGTLDPALRARLAASARKAFYLTMALKSAQARRARKQAEELDAEVARELGDLADREMA